MKCYKCRYFSPDRKVGKCGLLGEITEALLTNMDFKPCKDFRPKDQVTIVTGNQKPKIF